MVEVKISRDKNNFITGFQVTGHAGFDTRGKDLVCCAVSSIVQTAILGLNFVACIEADIKMEKGMVICAIKDSDTLSGETGIKTAAVLDTMLLGLKSIEKDYKEFILISEMTE